MSEGSGRAHGSPGVIAEACIAIGDLGLPIGERIFWKLVPMSLPRRWGIVRITIQRPLEHLRGVVEDDAIREERTGTAAELTNLRL